MKRLTELTRKELHSALDSRTKTYSKKVKSPRYLGITKDYTIHLEVPSVTSYPPTNYLVKVNLVEYPSLEDDITLTIEEKVRLCIDGDIKISCTCPAFLYWGYDYIVSQLEAKDGNPEDRYPSIRNPNLEGTLCKHSYIATRFVGRYWKKIAYDIRNNKFI